MDYERSVLGSGPRHFWRLRLSKGNIRKWTHVAIGDYIIFKGASHYFVSSRVIAKICDPILARSLWGADESGETWELMFEISRPKPINTPVGGFASIIGERAGGFERVVHQRLEMAFSIFGRSQFLQAFGIEESVHLD
jgi:hypothetical protein